MELWQAAFEYVVKSASTSDLRTRDRSRVEELFAQLYLLRERPSVDEVRRYLDERWPNQSPTWRRELLRLWRKRLRAPATRIRGTTWAYPFVIPEHLVDKHGIKPISERLLDALATAAREYIGLMDTEPDGESAEQAAVLFTLTAQAVRFWALSRDRLDVTWPSVTSRPRTPDRLAEYGTRSGRARHDARIERWRREWEESWETASDNEDENVEREEG